MRISDWSSDVCSSDLLQREVHLHVAARAGRRHGASHQGIEAFVALRQARAHVEAAAVDALDLPGPAHRAIAAVAAGEPGHAVDRLAALRHGGAGCPCCWRSEEHTPELQSPMRISYAVFCLN